MPIVKNVIDDLEISMSKKAQALKDELTKLRTGRAHPSLLDHIKADYYGVETPLKQMANITVSDARTLTLTPWDKSALKAIEKAILSSDLGLNPVSDGHILRVPMPLLTEDRRKELVKVVKKEGEVTKVAIRNLRRDANNAIKDLLQKKEITEDDERRSESEIQKITDKFIAEIDKLLLAKEDELMSI